MTFDNELKEHMAYFRNFARKLTRDKDAAEDLMQETLFKVFENRERYESSGNFKAWVTTIMRNLFINEYRKKVRQATQSFDPLQTVVIESYVGATENSALAELHIQTLHQFVNELSDDLKNPFVMYLHGFPYEEIGDLLNLEVNTLRGRVFHARKMLQQRINGLHSK